MADHGLTALRSAARAMEEVVLPAIDAHHPLAREQAGLVLRFLQLFEQRVDYAYQRNRLELRNACDLARSLMQPPFDVSAAISRQLADALATGEALLGNASARPSQLQHTATQIAGLVTALIRTLDAVQPALAGEVEQRVLDHAGPWLAAQRAWFLPQGWEPDATAVLSIDQVMQGIEGRVGP